MIKDDIAILMVYCFAFKRVLRKIKRPFKRRGYKILSYSKKARKKEKISPKFYLLPVFSLL